MRKYLCMIAAEKMMEQMESEDARQHFEEYREFTAGLRRSGQLVACNRLEPPAAAITVRVRGGQVLTTDGPYVETKEQIGGYFLIEARDMNEAIRLAAGIPLARLGSIEVRPIYEIEA